MMRDAELVVEFGSRWSLTHGVGRWLEAVKEKKVKDDDVDLFTLVIDHFLK
jgi:hypothetical protein